MAGYQILIGGLASFPGNNEQQGLLRLDHAGMVEETLKSLLETIASRIAYKMPGYLFIHTIRIVPGK